MGKHKSSDKEKGKGSQLVIRIDKAERAAFVSLCEQLDTSAAREIRRFMREFVATHAAKSETEKSAKSNKKNAAKAAAVEVPPTEQSSSEVSPSAEAVEPEAPKQPKQARRQKPV